jgi:hypothetical protein
MSDLSPETRRLLDLARDGDRLPPGRRALLESKFFRRVASGALVGLAARQAWAAKSAGLLGPLAKGMAGLAIVSSLGTGGYFALRAVSRYDAAPPRTSTEAPRPASPPELWTEPAKQTMEAPPPAPAVRVPRAPESTDMVRRSNPTEPRELSGRRSSSMGTSGQIVAKNSSSARVASRTAAAAPAQASPPPAPEPTTAPPEEAAPQKLPSTLADETRLLAEADQALRSGKTSRAMALLDEHASRYPEGALSLERGGERVVALCKLGRIDGVTVRAYLNSHPNLALAERIQQACASLLPRNK